MGWYCGAEDDSVPDMNSSSDDTTAAVSLTDVTLSGEVSLVIFTYRTQLVAIAAPGLVSLRVPVARLRAPRRVGPFPAQGASTTAQVVLCLQWSVPVLRLSQLQPIFAFRPTFA